MADAAAAAVQSAKVDGEERREERSIFQKLLPDFERGRMI